MDKPQILFVCTANICRSPTAEHLARRQPGGERFGFSSAGLLRAGSPCPDRLLHATSPRGVDLSTHRSRLVDRAVLAAADLVVTMEVGHLRDITVLDVAAFAKTVPFLELDAMLRQRPRTLPDLLDELSQRNPAVYLSATTDLDVPDPYGRNAKAYATAVEHIHGLVRTLTTRLLLPDGAQPPPPEATQTEPPAEPDDPGPQRSPVSDDVEPPPSAPDGAESPAASGEAEPPPAPDEVPATGSTSSFVWRRFRRDR